MTNDTRVFTLEAHAAERLEAALHQELPPDADWRPVAHARFSVKFDGMVVTCYRSGKLVVQGKGLDGFAQRYLAEALAADSRPTTDLPVPFDRPTIGSDETGKGDYFGPLVVAAVYAQPEQAAELRAMGVADSKTLGDRRMETLAGHIERNFDHEVRVLEPADYNLRHRADPNVNRILADLHADAIAGLLRRHPGSLAVVDRFAEERLVADRLRAHGTEPGRLVQVPRAEAHPVVAAASIVARVHFLAGMKRCEEAAGVDLHKGAGPPADAAGRAVLRVGGPALLGRVAKLHFRNTIKIGGGTG